MQQYGIYIDGAWIYENEQPSLIVTNPATGESFAKLPTVSAADVDRAIDAAYAAMPAWSKMPAKDRAAYLKAAAALMHERKDMLAELLTREQGKPLAEAKGEVSIAADYLEWNAEEAKRIYGEMIPASFTNKRLLAMRQPVGVVASITPWNFPISMITRKIGPAIAAGCTVVIKPASATPLSAVAMMQIFEEVGIPRGVVNLVAGSASMIAKQFLSNTKIRKISFTGSTEVGQTLMRGAADDVKKLSLELGGHAPVIVFDDADLNKAVDGVIASKFRNAGQTCICANRLYVQKGIYDQFVTALSAKVGQLKVGYGLEPGTEIGPLIDAEAKNRMQLQVADAIDRGGKVLTGGFALDLSGLEGNFFAPTLLANIPTDARVATEETFGPLLGVWSFETEEEVLALANNTPYGLASYFFAQNVGRIFRIAEGLEYGIVGVNDPVPTTVQAPFGGVKHSGLGREGGHQGIEEYVEWKYVSIGI